MCGLGGLGLDEGLLCAYKRVHVTYKGLLPETNNQFLFVIFVYVCLYCIGSVSYVLEHCKQLA